MSGSNHFGNQNVHLKYLNQNGHRFTLHYVTIDTVGLRVHVAQAVMGQDVTLGAPASPDATYLLNNGLQFTYSNSLQ